MYTVSDVIERLESKGLRSRADILFPSPKYTGENSRGIALAVKSMEHHMSDEGWQIMQGLQTWDYSLCGFDCHHNCVDVPCILESYKDLGVVVVQDKREWDPHLPDNQRESHAAFQRLNVLAERSDLFNLTILKDSHQRPFYHREAAREQNCHAWIIYYHPRLVSFLSGFVRPKHLIRTYHSFDKFLIPEYKATRPLEVLLSGAISNHYPLRQKIWNHLTPLEKVTWLRHPGYGNTQTHTPEFLKLLTHYKVSICTASMYGYALRKIFESTACGCRVLTDLPEDEVLPEIDGNLVRVHPDISIEEIKKLLDKMCQEYNPEIQEHYANRAKEYYDYRMVCKRLVDDIEQMRVNYALRSNN